MNTTQLTPTGRIDVVDALRGFAVMAILLVHNLEHFIFPVYPDDAPAWLDVIDKGVFDIVFALFAGKAYAIFALLFGFTFFLQSDKQRRAGGDFGYRYLWRMVGLVVFATINAAFFPGGDVLLLFAIVGLVLFVVRNWSDKAVLALAIIFTLQPIEWYHLIMGLVDASHQLPDYGVDAMYAEVAEATKSGEVWNFLWCNITLGQKASLMWAVGVGRLLQTAGLFLIGFYLGRKHLFEVDRKNFGVWIKILVISAIVFTPLNSLKTLVGSSEPLVQNTLGVILDMWQKLAFTFVLISSFVLLYSNKGFQKAVSSLRFYGRMSLTNYLSQSFIGAIIYFPFALYLAPYCGYALSLLVGIVVFMLQLLFCKWWLKNHKQGPLESLWHKWTWMFK